MRTSSSAAVVMGLAGLGLAGCGDVTVTASTETAPSQKPAFDLMTLRADGAIADEGLFNSSLPDISTDGRFVLFLSSAQLVPEAGENPTLFVRDREAGTTTAVSVNSAGEPGTGASEVGAISDDGCFVVFDSFAANLVAGDTNDAQDVFLHDRCVDIGATTRLSTRADGAETTNGSARPAITPDGRFAVYENGDLGVVRHELATGVVVPMTTTAEGRRPSIADDGTRVAFWSFSPLVPGDQNSVWDAYLWDQDGGLQTVSVDANGGAREQGDESSSRIVETAISGDGRLVSFATTASNLVPGDTTGFQDVFVTNVETNEIFRASVDSDGLAGNDNSPSEQGGRGALSRDGTWVAFETSSTNLHDPPTSDVVHTVRHNIHTGQTVVVEVDGSFGSGSRPALSGDLFGRFVAFFSAEHRDDRYDSAGIFVHDRHVQPTANAAFGSNDGSLITLDGSASHNDDNADYFAPQPTPSLTFTWSQLEGAAVTFDDVHSPTPTFDATPGRYQFSLVVNDGIEDSPLSIVTLDVESL